MAFVSKEKLENDTGTSKDKAGERKAHPVQNPGNNCFHSLNCKVGKTHKQDGALESASGLTTSCQSGEDAKKMESFTVCTKMF